MESVIANSRPNRSGCNGNHARSSHDEEVSDRHVVSVRESGAHEQVSVEDSCQLVAIECLYNATSGVSDRMLGSHNPQTRAYSDELSTKERADHSIVPFSNLVCTRAVVSRISGRNVVCHRAAELYFPRRVERHLGGQTVKCRLEDIRVDV
jgi:hypothetical protein